MSETVTQPTPETKTPGQIKSAGEPVRADMSNLFNPVQTQTQQASPDASQNGNQQQAATNNNENSQNQNNQSQQSTNGTEGKENQQDSLSESQVLAFLEKNGIKVDNLNTIKEKVAYTPPPPPPTPEEKKKQDTDLERRMIDLHISRGGTVENFAQMKSLIGANARDIGIEKFKNDLVKEGFSIEKAEELAIKAHFQISDEELDALTDDEKADMLKMKSFGSKKQENRGSYIKKQAQDYMDSLTAAIKESDTEKAMMEQHTAKAADAIKSFPREEVLQLGEYEGQSLGSVTVKLSDEVFAEVSEIVADPQKLDTLLFNKDGSYNLEFLIPKLVASISREKAVKHAFLEGRTASVDAIKAKFDSKPPALGGNKPPTGKPGQLATYGEPQVAQSPIHQR